MLPCMHLLLFRERSFNEHRHALVAAAVLCLNPLQPSTTLASGSLELFPLSQPAGCMAASMLGFVHSLDLIAAVLLVTLLSHYIKAAGSMPMC